MALAETAAFSRGYPPRWIANQLSEDIEKQFRIRGKQAIGSEYARVDAEGAGLVADGDHLLHVPFAVAGVEVGHAFGTGLAGKYWRVRRLLVVGGSKVGGFKFQRVQDGSV